MHGLFIVLLVALGAMALGGVIEGGQIITGAAENFLVADLGAPALGATTAVHAAVTDNGAQQTVTTAITNPDVPRNITATAGGTGADIGAIQVVIHGTNAEGVAISETLPAFTANTPGTVLGAKAFATVTSVVIPAHDGTGATTAIGTGSVLGLGHRISRDSIGNAYLGGTREGTRPTVAFSATAIESNTVELNSALSGDEVLVEFAQV